jgi:hypothetical protein
MSFTPNEPVLETVETEVPQLPELRYEYQPQDKQGRPIGGKQVIVYRTEDELRQKLVNQNVELVQKLREVTRNNRLGISPREDIPANAERLSDDFVNFKERVLSPEERFEISQQIADPEHFDSARDRLLESAIGVPPAKLREVLNQQQIFVLQARATENYGDFVTHTPDYFDCADNRSTLTDWMFKNKLAPTVDNFVTASSTLRQAGLLVEAPAVQQATTPEPVQDPVVTEQKSQSPVESESRITSPTQPQTKRPSHVPSGLNDRVSSSNGQPKASGEGNSMTLVDINRLTSDEYRAKMQDPAFRQLVDKLESEAAQRRKELIAANRRF